MHVCIPLNNLRYHTVGLNSRKASGKHVKRSEKVLKTSSEKYLLGYTQKTSKALLVLSLLVYFYADNIIGIWNVSWNMILHHAGIGKFSNLKSTIDFLLLSIYYYTEDFIARIIFCQYQYVNILIECKSKNTYLVCFFI